MTITELLALFANPETMHAMTTGDKLLAGLVTTVLGMGITFTSLIILQFVISWMDKLLNREKSAAAQVPAPVKLTPQQAAADPVSEQDENELIAAITVAIATQLKTSVDNIVIRNIEKIDNNAPAWHKAGIIEQMNSRF